MTHTGTHIDAPNHFIKGAGAIETVGLDRCVNPGVLLDLRGVPARGVIDRDALLAAQQKLGRELAGGEVVLLWTG